MIEMMTELNDYLSGLVAVSREQQEVTREQQMAVDLTLEKLQDVRNHLEAVPRTIEQAAREAVQAAVAETTERIRQDTAAAVLSGVQDVKADMQRTATDSRDKIKTAVDKASSAADGMTANLADAVGKLDKSLAKVLLIPIAIFGAVALLIVGMAWWAKNHYDQEAQRLREEIAQMKQTQAALDTDPLIRAKIGWCRAEGWRWHCVATTENAKTFIGKHGETLRIIDGLQPVRE